jgi:hypothetical protein
VSRVNVAIAVAEDARLRIYEIAANCRALGFEHVSTLADIGVLTGSAELDLLPRIRRLPGVVAVEIEREFYSQWSALLPGLAAPARNSLCSC